MPTKKFAVWFQNVTVHRGERDVLTDVTLKIGMREQVAIVGANGSGKSTLIKAMTRELYPTGGSVTLFGSKTWDVFALRSQLGIVSYDWQALFPKNVTALEAVLSGFFSSVGLWKNNRVTPAMLKQAKQILTWLGLTHLENETFAHISSGEARRVLIARALIHTPRLIVFDEPMNSLDLQGQVLVKKTLRKLARAGIGIVLVTHHLSDIIPEIERIVLLKNGRIFADGPKKEILTETNLTELFHVPLRLVKQAGMYHAY